MKFGALLYTPTFEDTSPQVLVGSKSASWSLTGNGSKAHCVRPGDNINLAKALPESRHVWWDPVVS